MKSSSRRSGIGSLLEQAGRAGLLAALLIGVTQGFAQTCNLYPIALPATALSNVAPNTVLPDIFQGQQPGNFGWLTWAGSPSVLTLVASLTPPGDSSTYVNPDNTADRQVSVGDWVQGKPGVSNSKNVRDALDALKQLDITVPVWNETRGQGEGAAYRVSAFARIRILGYQLPGQNRVSARFLGYQSCDEANLPPVVSAGADQTITLPAAAQLNGSVSDDGLPAGGALTLAWSVVSGPGTVTFANAGAAVTTASFGTHGTYVLRLAASDSVLNGSDDAIVTVNRENHPPVANGQSLTNLEDAPLDIVLAGGDPDGDALSFAIVAGPSHGALTGLPPNVRYTPFADYNGGDSFTFKANDGLLDSPVATVTITNVPVNDAPVADSQSRTNLEDTPLPVTLSGADIEGSSLTFLLLTAPAHGTLNVELGTLNSNELIYTPATNYNGPDSFTYKVSDGTLDSATATVAITVLSVNDIPLVDAGPDQLVSLPTNSITLAGAVTDDFFDGSMLTVEWSVVSGPGTVTFANAQTNHTAATFDASGTYVLRLTADDGFFIASDDAVIVVNAPPVVSAGTNQAITLPATTALNGAASDDGLPTNGTFTVAWSKVSGPGSVIFSAPNATNATASFGENGIFVLRLTASDGVATATSDVTVIANRAPLVDAGSDQLVTNLAVTLTGTVADDGLPPGVAAAPLWIKVSGPGEVTFASPSSPSTAATFSEPGIYVLRLSADDSLASSSDDVTITATEPNDAPVVYAGPNQLVILPALVQTLATVTDDGAPAGGAVSVLWTKLMGPGNVTFANAAHTNTTVAFSAPGNYILRLTADDGALTSRSDVTFVVKNEAMNAAPVVNAGADQTVGLTNQAALNAFAEDDGLPRGASLSVQWTKVSGPGAVTFANAASVSTTATFDQPGAYVLRLTASDSLLQAVDEVSVTVYPHNHPPVVEAGTDQTLTVPDPALLAGSGGNWSLVTSLLTVDRWNPSISQPGLARPPSWYFGDNPAVVRGGLSYAGTNLFVCGYFYDAGGETVWTLGRWDGSRWHPVRDLVPTDIPGAPGYEGFVVFDFNSGVSQVAARGEEIFALTRSARDFNRDGGSDSGARWTGTNWTGWSPQMFAGGGGVATLAAYDDAAYRGGYFQFQPTNSVNSDRSFAAPLPGLPVSHGIAKWDGTNWDVLGDGIMGQIGAIAKGKHGELYVAGAFMNNVADGVAHNIAKWDGTNWTRLGAGLQGCTRFACYTLIIALAVDADGAVYAAGEFTTAGGLPANGIAKWDGTNWSTLGSGPDNGFNPGGGAQALAVQGRNLYVGGNFSRVGGIPANNLAKWNGRFWSPLSAGPTNGVPTEVAALAPTPQGVYVGGDFTLFDGTASDIALWEFAPPPSRSVRLEGRVTDDGRPPGAALTAQWTKASGPGDVIFANAHSAITTAEFTQVGTYVLRLTASDSDLSAFDELTVVVQGNQPPVVEAGANVVVGLGQSATLAGVVTDDGEPAGAALVSLWSVVNGPGAVTFGDARDPGTSARFSAGGTYVLRLTANDSHFSVSDDVTVTVAGANVAPEVVGFSFAPAFLPDPAVLFGLVSDDGLPDGTLVSFWSKLSGPGQAVFANASDPNTPVTFTEGGFYLLRLTATDGELTSHFDAPVEVIDLFGIGPLPGPGQAAPVVNAGPDRAGVTYGSVALAGSVTDDGLPAGGSLTASWLRISGPAPVYFGNAGSPATTASFYAPGAYVLRLLASDGQLSGHDDVNIVITNPTNEPPLVFAGAHGRTARPAPARLQGTVLDDGLPAGYPLTIAWSKVSGPGSVTFSPSAAALDADAAFSASGEYVLRLTAGDGALTDFDEITVTVTEGVNQPPIVHAGPDQTIALPNLALLVTDATDDGLPGGLLGVNWSQVSGPGVATFTTVNGRYLAGFTAAGTYVLRLTATDYALTASDDVQVTVLEASDPPLVAIASPLDAAIVTAPTIITGTVTSASLQSWTLRYRLKPSDSLSPTGGEGQGEGAGYEWQTLATATTPVNNAPLATFDPTLLLNGLYELELTATDQAGRAATADLTLVVDRNMKVGHFTLSFNDLTIPVAGIPIQVIRTYDSRDKRVGDFGVGWTLDLKNIRLQKNRHLGRAWDQFSTGGLLPSYCIETARPRVVTITFPDGRVQKFQGVAVNPNTGSSCQALIPLEYPTLRFQPVGGNTFGALVPLFELNGQIVVDEQVIFPTPIPGRSDLISFERLINPPPGPADNILFNPDLFEFTSQEGYRYVLSETNGLRSVTDPNDNTLTITTNGITWTNASGGAGLTVAFQRDGLGRITNIVDALGHAMSYRYDTNGNLTAFTDRAGQTNGFTYDGRHSLLTLSDARGVTAMDNDYNAEGRLTRQTDANGAAFSYGYDIPNRVVAVTNRLGFTTVQEYDDDGNLVRATDAHGGVTTCTYDDAGRRTSRTDPLGHTSRYTYAETNGALIAVVNPLGQTNTLTYSAAGQVLRATEKDGTPLFAGYDAGNNVTNVVDALGHATVYAHNAKGKAVYSRNALGHEVRSEYDAFGNLLRSTNALGHVAEYAYDAQNNLVRQVLTRTVSGLPQRLTNSWQYDALNRVTNAVAADGSSHRSVNDASGRLKTVIDELGRQTHHDYDAMGRLVRTVFPDGSSEGIAYDAEDRKVAMTNRLGQVTRMLYDGLNRLVATIQPDGAGATNFYDAASRVFATTDARGNATFHGRDALGRLTSTTNALGQVSSFTYDARGNQITSTDALGRTTTNVFDLANRLVQVLFPDGSSQSTAFDALGRKIAETDANTNTTWFAYDALGRLTAVTNALGHVTRYEYNELGEQTAQIDAENRTTRYEYDTRGRRVSRILPLGQADFAVYDAVGNMLSHLDFNQNVTAYAYDTLNRLTQKTPDPRLGEPSVSFGYNALGLRTNMVDASGVTTYRYDARNRLVEKSSPQGTLFYGYDANGNVTNIQSSNVNGVALGYEYDPLNRLSAVNDPRLGRTDYAYDAVGNLQGCLLPNGVASIHSYDSLNRLTNLSTLHSQSTQLAAYDYTLARSGHRLAARELGGRVANYAYDVLYRLTSETVSGASAPQSGAVGYQYDKVGNRLARNSSLPGILASSYAYDANDRLAGDSYDANGNTRAATLRPNTTGPATPVNDQYDFENRLVNRNNGQVTVVYDGDGQRVRKTVGGVTTHYLVDELNPTGYAQVVEELTSAGGAPVVTRTYAWGHALLAQDQLRNTGTNFVWQASFYGYDGQGSVRYLTDGTGTITDTYDYDAFGNLIAQTPSAGSQTPNNYLYQGEQFDHDLGLYYLRARYADPDRGRFWTQDSFEGFGSDPASLHKYTFNHNDPVNRRDPSGHFSLTENQMVTALAPMVRGAVQALQSSFTSCYGRTVTMAALTGGAVGAAVSTAITGLIQAFTGEFSATELANAYVEGFAEGAKEGGLLAANPFAYSAYQGYQSMQAGLDFWKVINDPDAPTYAKYLQAVAFVTTALPVISPKLAQRMNDLLVKKFCFPPGTEVAVEDGTKPIEEIAVGDLVWSQSDVTGERSLKRVVRTFANVAHLLVILHCGTNTLEATPEHPLWVADKGWKAAGQVQIGDELWTRDGERVAVSDIGHKQGRFTVHNFEVEDWHSYFVGGERLLAHNECITENAIAGKAWELKLKAAAAPGTRAADQVTLRVATPSGPVNIRVDQLVEVSPGKYLIVEAKASATAPLTHNQSAAFPQIGKGATVEIRGNNGAKLNLDSGDVISIDEVIVVRPTGTSIIR